MKIFQIFGKLFSEFERVFPLIPSMKSVELSAGIVRQTAILLVEDATHSVKSTKALLLTKVTKLYDRTNSKRGGKNHESSEC